MSYHGNKKPDRLPQKTWDIFYRKYRGFRQVMKKAKRKVERARGKINEFTQ